jgi:hypothetical protein
MSKLVEELKSDHKVIAATLNKVSGLGISSPEGQKTLLAAKSGLLAHLKKEDGHLYPVLKNAANVDTELKRMLDTFAKDMVVVSMSALEFFDKYARGGDGLTFARDFGRLYATLSQRISREENVLYKKFDEIAH